MKIVAVLCKEFGISGIESQSIAASLQFGGIVVTFPVFVTADMVGVESKIIRALEAFLCESCEEKILIVIQLIIFRYVFQISVSNMKFYKTNLTADCIYLFNAELQS